MESIGKNLVFAGIALALVGAALWVFGRAGAGFLPGDIVVERKHFKFYFPIVTCLALSALFTLISWLFRR